MDSKKNKVFKVAETDNDDIQLVFNPVRSSSDNYISVQDLDPIGALP